MSISSHPIHSDDIAVSQPPKGNIQPNYVLITGPGRSGTTWLGQIMNTYKYCGYKYEPFLPSKSTPYSDWKQDLESGSIEDLRGRFRILCNKCYHDVDLPPFPAKSFRTQNPKLLHLLYGLSKRFEALKPLYEWYGCTELTEQIPVLIKDVNFPNHLLPRLCEVLQPSLIPMIRNPFAQIASYLKGVELNLFRKDHQQQVTNLMKLLDTPEGKHLSHYRDQLKDMSVAQFEAVRWRFQVEPLVQYSHNYDKSLLVVYEDLCADPHNKIAEIFNFVGWELDQASYNFIDALRSNKGKKFGPSKASFSVYRDPRTSLSKWKTQLTDEQVQDITSVFCESPLKSLWPDLLL
ncbi:MAG: sulfotransferase domain-containing protein [Cyanothece sp. SIO1E1]|nr:sulfotransferase domain-containing protein [Cyanothece sp. SIO1E1]